MQGKSCCTPQADHGDAPQAAGAKYHPQQLATIPRRREGKTDDMVLLDGGAFTMGTDLDEVFPPMAKGPARQVERSPSGLVTQVTNRQFAAFIKATGYVTEASEIRLVIRLP